MRRLLTAALLAVVACDDTAPRTLPGEYSLHAVDGRALPYDGITYRVLGGNIRVHDDGTYVDVYEYSIGAYVGADTLYGTWKLAGDTVGFTAAVFGYRYKAVWAEPYLTFRTQPEFRYRRVR